MHSLPHGSVRRRPPLGRWLLALLVVEMVPSALGRTLLRRFDLSRKNVVTHAAAEAVADTPAQQGIVVKVVVSANAGNSSAEEVADALKFNVANEGMRSVDLQNFLAGHGVDPKAQLPPVHEVNPGGDQVPLGVEGVSGVDDPEAQEEEVTDAPVAAAPSDVTFSPAGYQTTVPPSLTTATPEGYWRNVLTTHPMIWQDALEGKDISSNVQDVLDKKTLAGAVTAPPAAWEWIGGPTTTMQAPTTPLMMIHPSSYTAYGTWNGNPR
jgi:hypothetical protein